MRIEGLKFRDVKGRIKGFVGFTPASGMALEEGRPPTFSDPPRFAALAPAPRNHPGPACRALRVFIGFRV